MTLSSSARRSRRLDFTPVQAEALADSGQDNDATKEDITNLRADLIVKFADLKVETVLWIVGAVATSSAPQGSSSPLCERLVGKAVRSTASNRRTGTS